MRCPRCSKPMMRVPRLMQVDPIAYSCRDSKCDGLEIIHELKTWPRPFAAVRAGHKTHEVRKDDRGGGYHPGHLLRLREWDPSQQAYTGETELVRVTHKTDAGTFELPVDVCVLSVMREDACLMPKTQVDDAIRELGKESRLARIGEALLRELATPGAEDLTVHHATVDESVAHLRSLIPTPSNVAIEDADPMAAARTLLLRAQSGIGFEQWLDPEHPGRAAWLADCRALLARWDQPREKTYIPLAEHNLRNERLHRLALWAGDDGQAQAYWLHLCRDEGVWSLRSVRGGTTIVVEFDTIERTTDDEDRIPFLDSTPPCHKALWLEGIEDHDEALALLIKHLDIKESP